jgi:hypothetical protein
MHDRWFNVPSGRHEYVIPHPAKPIIWTDDPPDLTAGIDRELYTVERLVWPGWRFPIRVLVAPGVKIHGHPTPYDSSWPNPLVDARCRCVELGADLPWAAQYNVSASHLDHCPIHGRWTFDPITPIEVSLEARERWLNSTPGTVPNHAHSGSAVARSGPEPT